MGFVSGLLGGSKGAGFQAQQDPNAIANLQAQQGVVANNEAQLQDIANGGGPNPALAQLQETTGQNIQNAAGLVASQKGLNPALAARLAGMQAGQLNQQAANQAAGLSAQQQLGAIGQIGNEAIGQQGVTQQGLSSANSGNSQVANTNASSQAGGLGGLLGAAGTVVGSIYGGPVGGAIGGKLGSSIGGGKAHGGMIGYANGGNVGPQSFAGNYFNNPFQPIQPVQAYQNPSMGMGGNSNGGAALQQGTSSLFSSLGQLAARNAPDNTPSPNALPQWGNTADDYKNLGTMNSIADYKGLPDAPAAPINEKDGGDVPGKAKVKGDSYANDTVDAKLSPGEIVIPRSVLQSKNPALAAAHFVEQEMAKHAQKKSNFYAGGMSQEDEEAPDSTDSSEPLAPNSPMMTQNQSPSLQVPEIGPGNAAPQASSPQLNGAPSPDYISQLEKGFKLQGEGAKAKALAEQRQGQAEAQAYGQQSNQMQAVQDQYMDKLSDLDSEHDRFLRDVGDQKIDYNRYLGNMETGPKIATSIGLILGGLGGGLMHQENPALKFLQSQIDNDIKQQQAQLGQKQTLLSANLQQYGNLERAIAVTRANMLGKASADIGKATALGKSGIAAANGQFAQGVLNNQTAQTIQPLKMQAEFYNAAKNGTGNVDPANAIRYMLPANEQTEAFKDLKDFQDKSSVRDNILGSFNAVKNNRAIFQDPTFRQAAQNSMNSGIIELAKDATGRFNIEAANQLRSQFKPGYFDSPEALSTRFSEMNNQLAQKMHYPRLQRLMPIIQRAQPTRFDQSGNNKIQEGAPKT